MEISDIVYGITNRIDEIFPNINIYVESVEQNMQTPCVFVKLVSFEHIQQINKRWRVTPTFSIQYFPENGALEASNANLKIQQGIDDIELINGVKMLARAARSENVDGPNGDVIGQNFARFDFFLQRIEDIPKMETFQQWVNKERVNNIV